MTFKTVVNLMFKLSLPILYYGFWVFPEGVEFGKYTLMGYFFLLGLGISLVLYSVLDLLNCDKWDYINKGLAVVGLIPNTIILTQFIRVYWTGGGFEWIDVVVGVIIGYLITPCLMYLSKITSKQKDVQRVLYNYELMRDGVDDVLGNSIAYIRLKAEVQQKKGMCMTIDNEQYVLMPYITILEACDKALAKKSEVINTEI